MITRYARDNIRLVLAFSKKSKKDVNALLIFPPKWAKSEPNMELRFDKGPYGKAACFTQATQVIEAWDAASVPSALATVQAARDAGAWVAGYACYEMGYALEPILWPLLPQNTALPLLRFGVYETPKEAADLPSPANTDAEFGSFTPEWDLNEYRTAFDKARRFIGAGDVYQINLTLPLWADTHGDAKALYAALCARQAVKYGALILQEDLPDILCRSPELFFRTDQHGLIETHPMKGTQPRSRDAKEDAKKRIFLQHDAKNRAENLMIVDLLRNDLSRVARTGSVKVSQLYEIESYATVHQMVTRIKAHLRADMHLGDIFAALFPCGSITGAPKIRAMQIIHALERTPRDIYCGAIGWAAPDGRSEFSVAIRTLLLDNKRARLNVGGGIVWDSTAATEYEEAMWKTRFITPSPKTPS